MTIVMWALLGVLLLAWFRLPGSSSRSCGSKGVCCSESRLSNVDEHSRDVRGRSSPRGLHSRRTSRRFGCRISGGDVGLEEFDTRVLLVHWSPDGSAEKSRPTSPGIQQDLQRRKTELVLVSYGSRRGQPRPLRGARPLTAPSFFSVTARPSQGFARMGTPAYLLDDRHRIAKPVAVAREVPQLAEEAAGGRRRLASERPLAESLIEREGLKAGVSAPTFEPDLAGRTVSLADQRGRRVLLVFSDPECGPATPSSPISLGSSASIGKNGLAVVMVGRGEPEENRAPQASGSSSRSCSNQDGGSPRSTESSRRRSPSSSTRKA